MRIDRSAAGRRPGLSSRLRPGRGAQATWTAPNGQVIALPVIVDHLNIDPASGEAVWQIEATIDLVEGQPALVDIRLSGSPCLDTVRLQRFFRWATPIEIVRSIVPLLMQRGVDPFEHEFPTDGYPDAGNPERKPSTALSDAFLEEVGRQYLEIGRGYARAIADQRGVAVRTVVSWVQKARRRGILSRVKKGSRGGRIVPRGDRPPRR